MNQEALIIAKLKEMKSKGNDKVRIMLYETTPQNIRMIQGVHEFFLQDNEKYYPVLTKAGKVTKHYRDLFNGSFDGFDITCLDRS